MVILTNPNNPTGTVLRRESLQAIADFIIAHDLILVVDQAFEDAIFDEIELFLSRHYLACGNGRSVYSPSLKAWG